MDRVVPYFVIGYLVEPGLLPVAEMIVSVVGLSEAVAEAQSNFARVCDMCLSKPPTGFSIMDANLEFLVTFQAVTSA